MPKTIPNDPSVTELDEVTLDEFCAGLSLSGHTTEIIGGFHLDQRHAGCIKAANSTFLDRFQEYSTREIK